MTVCFSSLAPEDLVGSAASQPVSASSYRLTENVFVVSVVVPPFEFGHVKRQVFGADVVERANDAAFQEKPEPVDRLGVNVLPGTYSLALWLTISCGY
jgi:hypothetical protein